MGDNRFTTALLRRIRLTAAAMLMLGAAMFVMLAMRNRQGELELGGVLAASLANATAQRIGGQLRAIDILLSEAVALARTPDGNGADPVRLLQDKVSALPELLNVSITDVRGRVRLRTDNGPLGLDASNGANFLFQSRHAEDNAFHIARSTFRSEGGAGILLMSRPITTADGRFLGMAQASAVPALLRDSLSAILPAHEGAAAVYREGAAPLAFVPTDCAAADRPLAALLAKIGAGDAATSAFAACPDGVTRIVGIARVPHYPLVVAVGISDAALLRHWWAEEKSHAMIGMAFAVLAFLFAWNLERSERERAKALEQLSEASRRHVETLSKAVDERTAELAEANAALRESEERFRTIVDTSPLPLVLTRMDDGTVAYINEDAARTFGISYGTLPPGALAVDFYANSDDRRRLVEILAAEGHVRAFETVLVRTSGERFIALLSAASFVFGRERMILVAVHDITEIKRLNEELARSNAELEQFSYAVSHDLQEPLRMVSSYLTLLERRYRNHLDNEARDFIAFAVDGGQRMSRMITDLLEYSRIHTRGAEFSEVDLGRALGEALINLGGAMEATGATIKADPLPHVAGDPSQVIRLFQNLIGNALKYRRLRTAPDIRVTASRSGDEWTISITDDGIGIDPTQTGRLFQVFQRLHPLGEYEGTGIGLALCRRIVERHGGHIWAESAGPNQGSTFRFTLPASPANRARG